MAEHDAQVIGEAMSKESLPQMDMIETKRKSEVEEEAEGHHHGIKFAEVLGSATKHMKPKMYLHHRYQRKLSKQFSPGSAFKHLPWTHRDTPKPAPDDVEAQDDAEPPAPSFVQNLKTMATTFPYWNMAFWSGFCYSTGSVLFVIDGAMSWTPLQWPSSEFDGEEKWAVPLIFFFGACLYQVGGVIAYLEAVNDGSFAGAAMKKLFHGQQDVEKEFLDAKLHTFFGHIVPHRHHEDKSNDESIHPTESNWDTLQKNSSSSQDDHAQPATHTTDLRRGGMSDPTQDRAPSIAPGTVREYLTWRWYPTSSSLMTYHMHELGYIACAIQLFGVTLYGVCSVVLLPGIFDTLVWWQQLGAYWYPALIGSCCFLVASVMFTVMAQERWYLLGWGSVSWWIGVWAILGSCGFLLNAIFGILSNAHAWAAYQSPLSSMWGSFFYMLSGLFQWYEAINVNVGPVLAFPNNRTPVLLRSSRSR